jgi:hypothetical protein
MSWLFVFTIYYTPIDTIDDERISGLLNSVFDQIIILLDTCHVVHGSCIIGSDEGQIKLW